MSRDKWNLNQLLYNNAYTQSNQLYMFITANIKCCNPKQATAIK